MFIVFCGMAALLAGTWSLRSNHDRLLAGVLILLGVGSMYAAVRLLLDSRPGLVLDASGMWINDRAGEGGLVPWNAMEGIWLAKSSRVTYLLVKVKDPDRVPLPPNPLKRMLAPMNKAMLGTPVYVNTSVLDHDRGELLERAEEFRLKYGGA